MNAHQNFNTKNPAIKRLLRELSEFQKDPSSQFIAAPLEDDLFEWHFTIRGQKGSDFEGGLYHGRIVLPPEYPFKPPHISFLTPNGRFEVGKKICLSISAYHPEEWQPSWSIRTVLVALIGFMPTNGEGAIGALDYDSDERKRLALLSSTWCCPTCRYNPGSMPTDRPEDAQAIAETEQKVYFTTKPETSTSETKANETPSTSTEVTTTTTTTTTTTPNPAPASPAITPAQPTITQTTPAAAWPHSQPPTPAVVNGFVNATTTAVTAPVSSVNPTVDTLTWIIYVVAGLLFALLLRRFSSSS